MSNSDLFTRDEEIGGVVRNGRPHVVILGAGASRAALPNGDANRRKLPVMNDLIELLRLQPLISKAGLSGDQTNFEIVYSKLAISGERQDILNEMESRVFSYFQKLQLPGRPTIYDYLLLSLRPKDTIATFNWDPFLVQAYERNRPLTTLPRLLFLHGNVRIGYCNCTGIVHTGLSHLTCSGCGNTYKETKLLYPVEKKDYQSDPFIKASWEQLEIEMQEAISLTIFGYSAPASDMEAKGLLKRAWNAHPERIRDIQIIDIIDGDLLYRNWQEFHDIHAFTNKTDFFQSSIAIHPRRTLEATIAESLDCKSAVGNPLPSCKMLKKLHKWIQPLLEVEARSEIN